jgi:hypothetical protein
MRAPILLARYPGRALASLALAVVVGVVVAADPSARGRTPDPVLAGQASAALAADPELAGLNLIVDVVHGSAEVGGPVPRMELAGRIESVLREVPGLVAVKVTVWVPSRQDSLSKLVGQELQGAARNSADRAQPVAGAPPLLVLPRAEPESKTAIPLQDQSLTDEARVTVQRIPASNLVNYLLEPVGPGGSTITPLPMPSPAEAVGRKYPTIPPTAVPAIPTGRSVSTGFEAIRAADPRFAGLRIELRDGTATIAGTARRTADAWDFAAAVRRVAGVERVVIGEVNGW